MSVSPRLGEGSSTTPPIPKWPITKRFRQARSTFTRVLRRWMGVSLAPDLTELIAREIGVWHNITGKKGLLALVSTVAQHEGHKLTPDICRTICLQVVWNSDLLAQGQALTAYRGVNRPTWMPFEIVNITEGEMRGRRMARLQLLCIGSRGAGYMVDKTTSFRYLRFMAYQLGFNRSKQYEDTPESLHELQFAGLVIPTDDENIEFSEYALTSSMAAHNRTRIKELFDHD